MKFFVKAIIILALGFVPLFSSYAQSSEKVKQANNLMQQAGMQLLVHKNYESACSLYEQAAVLYRKEYGNDNRKYLEAIKGAADCYDKIGNTRLAVSNYRKLLKSNDIWQTDYVCLQLGRIYKQMGNVDASIDVYTTGIAQYKKNGGRWNNNYYRIYKELYKLYYDVGNLSEAARVCAEFCDLISVDKPRWLAFSSDLATIYEQSGDHLASLKLYHEILSVYEAGHSLSGDNNESIWAKRGLAITVPGESVSRQYNIAEVLRGIGSSYFKIGSYEKATEYFLQSYNKFKALNHSLSQNVFFVLIPLSNCYSEIHYENASIKYAREAYEMVDRYDLGEDKEILALTNYANILLSFGKEKEAFVLLNSALNNNADNRIKANICNSISCIYAEQGDFDKAIEFSQSAVSLSNDPEYLHNQSVLYSNLKDYDKASSVLIKSWELAVAEMKKMLLQNREDDYGYIWDKYKVFIKAPVTLLWQTDNAEILKYAYNSLLMTKSIQLATSLRIRKIIYDSGDAELKELYNKWINSTEEQSNYIDVELELLSKAKNLGGDFDIFNIRWNDVQKKLKKGEIAVEFAHITRTDTNEKAYLALILTSQSKTPECVIINIDNSIEKLYRDNEINTLYNSARIGDLIWSKVIDAAKKTSPDIKTIYFVPDGVLHSMSIEYMISHGSRMSEKYNMRRLSSTRDIVKGSTQKSSSKSAVLFGGIDYNLTVEDMEYYSYSLTQERSADMFWSYLPGTQEEIEQIESILSRNSYTTELHSGASCIEEQFKIYSKNSPEIIHIATHGFYKHDESAENENEAISEGISLKKCGLAFAGANQSVLGNHNIPDDVDDGILSASEISKLELGNTSLVVMSACQTGLGDINDDGVLGLQRAFKKAGVNSILMSVWNVDDLVTQCFMTEFYNGLTQGLTKHQALTQAQQYVIQKYGNNPRYWAPFVLLD